MSAVTASPDGAAGSKWVRAGGVVAVGVVLAVVAAWLLSQWRSPRGRGAGEPRLAVFAESEPVRLLLGMSEEQPKDPEWQLRLGREWVRQGHFLSAEAAFKQALRLGAPPIPTHWGLATCYERLDQYQEALQQFHTLRSLEPENLSIPLRAAELHHRLGQAREARATLHAIPRDARGYPRLRDAGGPAAGLERLAVAYGLQQEWRRSLADARVLLRDEPRRVGALVVAAQAELEMGEPNLAIPHFRAALAAEPERLELKYSLARALEARKRPSDDDEIVRLLEPVVQTGSPPGDVVYSLAVIHERHRRWSWATAYYASAARMGVRRELSQARAALNAERAGRKEEAAYLRAREFELRKQLPQAIAAYRRLIRLRPDSDAGYRHLARTLLAAGDPPAAIETLRRAAALPKANPRVFFRLGLAYQQAGDQRGREQAWQEFRKRSPDESYVVEANQATAADTAGRLDEAETHLRRCLDMQPDAVQYRIRLAQLLLERRSEAGRIREATVLLEAALPSAREDVEAHLALGTAYRYSGRPREAIWAIRHAIDLDPGNGRPYQLLGEALIESGARAEGMETLALFKRFREYSQALSVLSLRLKRNPRDGDVARRLGLLQERSGAFADARTTYTLLAGLNPRDRWAQTRLAAVQARLGDAVDEEVTLTTEATPR